DFPSITADVYNSFVNHNGDDKYRLWNDTAGTQIDSFAIDRTSPTLTSTERDQAFAQDVVVFRVLSALPNDGEWGGTSVSNITDATYSPSGNWYALATSNSAAVSANGTPGFGGGAAVEVPVEL